MDKQPMWLRETQVPEMVSYVQGEFEELMSSPIEPLAQGHGQSPSGAASRSDHPSTTEPCRSCKSGVERTGQGPEGCGVS